ncbi:MAG TPA: VOC family protein [Limnochordales bacterium]
MSISTAKIYPHLWYVKHAEKAARFYVSIFPDSRIDHVTYMPTETPAGPPGSVQVVDFTLFGQRFQAISAGPHHDFNDAISFVVLCETQEELDRYWYALLEGGGQPQACGWLIDKFGVRWQILPRLLDEIMRGDNPEGGKRAADALMKMVKIGIVALEAAYYG